MMGEVSPETSPKNTMIQDMINSETIWIQLNRQTQTYSRGDTLTSKYKGPYITHAISKDNKIKVVGLSDSEISEVNRDHLIQFREEDNGMTVTSDFLEI